MALGVRDELVEVAGSFTSARSSWKTNARIAR